MRTRTTFSKKGAAIAAAGMLGLTVLVGCSSSDSADSSQTTSQDSQALPPVILEPGETQATAKVGEFIVVKAVQTAGTTIATNNPDILKVQQAYEDGSAIFNAGAQVLAPGNATITVTLPDNSSYQIAVTATE
jgi:hypothetical protein